MVRVVPVLASIVTLGVLAFDDVLVIERDERLDATMADLARQIPATADAEMIAKVRAMYRRLGIDPTKTRPSSEALLRRVRKGESLPQVNSLVDLCNWCSLQLQLPYGLYDRDRIRGPVELRLGRPGESYRGIRKGVVHLGARPVLCDDEGPFGNPTSDSARTMITITTARAFVVIFAPCGINPNRLTPALELTSSRFAEFAGAREVDRFCSSCTS